MKESMDGLCDPGRGLVQAPLGRCPPRSVHSRPSRSEAGVFGGHFSGRWNTMVSSPDKTCSYRIWRYLSHNAHIDYQMAERRYDRTEHASSLSKGSLANV
jgi:hypothetical protein